MRFTTLILSTAVMLLTGAASANPAQSGQPTAQGQADKKPEAAKPEPAGPPVNIKMELTITDQAGPGEPLRKTVSMILANGAPGLIRTQGAGRLGGDRYIVELNVDANAVIQKDDTIRLSIGLEYKPKPEAEANTSDANRLQQLHQRQTLLVRSGKPVAMSQAADPASDRKIIAEVTATILK